MTEIQKWADTAMYAAEPMEEAVPRVYLLSATPDPLGAIAAACMMYEGKVCRDIRETVNHEMREHYWEQVQKTHLKAPLEFVDLHFLIEGVTRSFTHQLVRQRTAVYAQESMRFAVKENLEDEVPLPPSLMGLKPDDPKVVVWKTAIREVGEGYESLVNSGVPAEDARGLLPHSVTTRVHFKTNLRNLVDHAGNRLCTQAQYEWRAVFASLVKSLRFHTSYPQIKESASCDNWQYRLISDSNLFRPVCYQMGKCPFNADFDRGCTIRSRVEEGKFNEIDVREWLADPAAARR